MELSENECKLVEENHNLIYGYAHLRGLSIEEYYGLLAITLCEAAKSYDPKAAEFSTYYYVSCDNAMANIFREQAAKKREDGGLLSLNYMYKDDSGLYEISAEEILGVQDPMDVEGEVEYKLLLEELLDSEYGEIVKLRMDGYTQEEIAVKKGITQQRVAQLMMRMREEYFEDE